MFYRAAALRNWLGEGLLLLVTGSVRRVDGFERLAVGFSCKILQVEDFYFF